MKQKSKQLSIFWTILPVCFLVYAFVVGWIGYENQEAAEKILAITGIGLGGIVATWIVILSPMAGVLKSYCIEKDMPVPFWVDLTCRFWKAIERSL